MKAQHLAITLLVTVAAACDPVVAPNGEAPSLAVSQSPNHMMATGTFNQTAITSLDSRAAGPNTMIAQKSTGTVFGTLSGSYTDDISVVIHPNGRFNAQFTISCECTVDGKSGTLELVASDQGELVSPTVATLAGQAVITGASGELSGLRGVLEITGTIDLVTGLATYDYSGTIH